MSNSLAVRAKDLRSMLDASKGQIAMALPRHMTPERMIRVALTAARKDSKLMTCDLTSIVGAVMEASQLGLEPDGVLGYAYLVPYGQTCTLIPGYKGLIALAKRTGDVANIWAMPVFKGDRFDYEEGIHRDLKHKPNLETKDRENPKNLEFVYAVVTFKDGRDPDFEVMTTAQVKGIQAKAKAHRGPWTTDFVEMARKTAIKRLLKRHDLSPEVAQANALDDAAFAGAPIDFSERVPDAVKATATASKPEKKSLDKLADDLTEDDGDQPAPWDRWGHDNGQQQEPEPEGEEAPEADKPKPKPDRRQRKTCISVIQERMKAVGQERTLQIRDEIMQANGLESTATDPNSMPIEVVREIASAMESAVDPEGWVG